MGSPTGRKGADNTHTHSIRLRPEREKGRKAGQAAQVSRMKHTHTPQVVRFLLVVGGVLQNIHTQKEKWNST